MSTALLVAYYFPPLGGAGVQRSLKFARYLPDFSVTPVVVAGPPHGSSRWEPEDPGLLAELHGRVPVHRATGAPASGGSRVARLLGRTSGVEAWWAEALVAPAEEAIAVQRPDALFVTLSPFAALASVLELGRRHGLPVVADLRDPWALDEIFVYPSRWHRARAVRAMGELLARTDRVILNTPETLRAVRDAFPALDPARLSVITNGYDEHDFAGLTTRLEDGRVRLVHTGYLHTAFGRRHRDRGLLRRALGGEACDVDFLGRSHWYLLAALRLLAQRGVDLSALELHLVGVLSPEDRALLTGPGCPLAPDQLRLDGYLDHAATVQAQVDADVLFLPMHALPDGRRARIVPGKTYEYLASGRPILAAVPEGDAADFVRAAEAGEIVAPTDVEGLARTLAERLEAGRVATRPLGPEVTRFERRVLSEQLAVVLTSTS